VDFGKTKHSTNIIDRTNRSRAGRFLDDMATYLNPISAYRNYRSELIKAGYIQVPGSDMMADNARRIVEERMQKRDDLLARGLSLEEAEAIIANLK
jgi:hypothetical protein